ncbi:MAG: hypothetical protein JEZ04_14775 [Spirochaetales bacterium]|nr:hypothetical protein [Spirochaetales bacterium]
MITRHTFSQIIILSLLFLFLTAASVSAERVTVRLHFAITEATDASPPELIDNHLVLTYKGARRYRFVGAAFQHEDFKKIHPFYINTNGVYVLTYPLKEDMKNLDYRIVVDGLWMTDPENPVTSRGLGGISLSSFTVPEKAGPPESPQTSGKQITFIYNGNPGQRVYVYGDFNNWEPYMFRMRESGGSGTYTYTIRAREGKYKYKFIVDGTSLADPLNDSKTIDAFGETASILTVAEKY